LLICKFAFADMILGVFQRLCVNQIYSSDA